MRTNIALKRLCLAAALTCATSLYSQPKITRAEDFQTGTILQFRNCDPKGVYAGKGGANQTWDFSGMTQEATTVTETIISPFSAPKVNDFPTSTLAEKYSDGSYVFIKKTAASSYLVGYVDSTGLEIKYPESPLFIQRPMTYKDSFVGNFTDKYSVGKFDFVGGGKYKVVADGYGTLKLPNGTTHTDVLRLKMTQLQYDTIKSVFSTAQSTYITWMWFDTIRYSALMKLDSNNYGQGPVKTVQFLENEAGINDNMPVAKNLLQASISHNKLIVTGEIKPGQICALKLYNISGQEVFHTRFTASGAGQQTFEIPSQPQGMYILDIRGNAETTQRIKIENK